MAISKVIYGSQTLVDLTADTVTSDNLVSGIKAHTKAGEEITGTLVVKSVTTGTTEPSSDYGDDGDIFLVIES